MNIWVESIQQCDSSSVFIDEKVGKRVMTPEKSLDQRMDQIKLQDQTLCGFDQHILWDQPSVGQISNNLPTIIGIYLCIYIYTLP